MHTHELTDTKKMKRAQIRAGRVHHNADWSGTARVEWTDADGQEHVVEVPAVLVAEASRRATLSEAISLLEDL